MITPPTRVQNSEQNNNPFNNTTKMKKTFLTIAAALVMCLPTFAQQQQKVDPAALQKKIEKSDLDIANEKKAAKASTWVKRAEAMMAAENAYTSQIYDNMEANMVQLMLGKPKGVDEAIIDNTPYFKMNYGAFNLYISGDQKVKGWEVVKPVYEGAIDKAIEAQLKRESGQQETDEERAKREKAEREANGGETNAEKAEREAREAQEREANGGETNAEKAEREAREQQEREAEEARRLDEMEQRFREQQAMRLRRKPLRSEIAF